MKASKFAAMLLLLFSFSFAQITTVCDNEQTNNDNTNKSNDV